MGIIEAGGGSSVFFQVRIEIQRIWRPGVEIHGVLGP